MNAIAPKKSSPHFKKWGSMGTAQLHSYINKENSEVK
jgi:hypothetical protein